MGGLDVGSVEGRVVIEVVVKYTRDGHGWRYDVLAASGDLRWLGGGWSAGKKRDAQDSFLMSAREKNWIPVSRGRSAA